jgi:hypothetical protein
MSSGVIRAGICSSRQSTHSRKCSGSIVSGRSSSSMVRRFSNAGLAPRSKTLRSRCESHKRQCSRAAAAGALPLLPRTTAIPMCDGRFPRLTSVALAMRGVCKCRAPQRAEEPGPRRGHTAARTYQTSPGHLANQAAIACFVRSKTTLDQLAGPIAILVIR